MSKQQRGLGKGLGALLGGDADLSQIRKPVGYVNKEVVSTESHPQQGTADIMRIPMDMIEPNPFQPRMSFGQEALEELAESIRTLGLIQPITVRHKSDGRYQIIAGERRWRASKLAGLDEIPALVLEKDDLAVAQISLVENIQRENLNPIEEAMAYRSLAEEFGMTQEDLARQVGKSRSSIANAVRLLELPDDVLNLVAQGDLSAGHARTLLGLRDRELIPAFAARAVAEELSVRDLEEAVKKANKPTKEKEEKPATFKIDYVAELERKMMQGLGRKVKISASGGKKLLSLYFEDNEDLEQLLRQLMGEDFVTSL
jgi:ParB family chromosome partitioning protein